MKNRKADNKPHGVFRRVLSGFVSASPFADDAMRKVKLDECVVLELKQPRNLKHHRKFWSLLKLAADNSDYDDAEAVLCVVKAFIGCGRFVRVEGAKNDVFVPGSISFAKMSQDEFDRFYEKALKIICAHVLKGADADEVRQEIYNQLT